MKLKLNPNLSCCHPDCQSLLATTTEATWTRHLKTPSPDLLCPTHEHVGSFARPKIQVYPRLPCCCPDCQSPLATTAEAAWPCTWVVCVGCRGGEGSGLHYPSPDSQHLETVATSSGDNYPENKTIHQNKNALIPII